MKTLIQIIGISSFLLMFTQCSIQDQVPKTGEFNESWFLTYDDYRCLKYGSLRESSAVPVPQEYQNLNRPLKVSRKGKKIFIKGILPEYPDACIIGKIVEDKVMFEPTQLVEGTGNEKFYFHCGVARQEFPAGIESNKAVYNILAIQISFNPDTSPEERPAFEIKDDYSVKSLKTGQTTAYSFWLSKDKEGLIKYYSKWQDGLVEGTGFPTAPSIMVNMQFHKDSDSGSDEPEAN